MIFKRKTRYKSTKHGEIASGSRGGSRTPTAISSNFYTPSTTLRPNGARVLTFRIQKNSVLVG